MKKLISVFAVIFIMIAQTASFRAKAVVPLEIVDFFTEVKSTSVSDESVSNKKSPLVFTYNSEMFVDVPKDIAGSSSVQRVQYDARDYGYVTSVKNQGSTGGCWSFCSMSMLESDCIMKGLKNVNTVDFSESHLVWYALNPVMDDEASPFYGDGANVSGPYFYGGNWLIATSALAKWSGVAEDADFPYYPNDATLMGNYPESERFNRDSGIVIESAQLLTDNQDVKKWIVEHGSAMALIYFDKYYLHNANGEYSYYYPTSTNINHAITIIGWDDSYSASNFAPFSQPLSNGAWLCKNSWGNTFGKNGYFWVSYSDPTLKEFAGISAQSGSELRNNYSYNGTYWVSAINHSGTAQIASVFTTKEYESLSEISTYTLQPGTDITVYVYTGVNKGNPVSGTLAYTYSTHIERSGYHTVDFPGSIDMEPGTRFSVVLELSHSSGSVYIPIENNSDVMAYSCKEGESFLNLPAFNNGWYDVKAYNVQNTFIQAFTKCNHQNEQILTDSTCTDEGSNDLVCSQCGAVETLGKIQPKGHSFSEWSEFEDVEGSAEKRSTRICQNCDLVETKSYIDGNVYTLADFFRMIYDAFVRFIEMIIPI